MPFYRINGMKMHIRFGGRKRPPAPCVARIGFSPQAGEVDHCCDISAYLCDWPVGTDGKTCDAPLCEAHAQEVGKNRHLCPTHYAEHTHQNPQRALFTELESVT